MVDIYKVIDRATGKVLEATTDPDRADWFLEFFCECKGRDAFVTQTNDMKDVYVRREMFRRAMRHEVVA